MDIFLILLLIAINGVFAMSEIAIVSSRRIRLQHMADQGDRGARAALALADQPTFFLSTVQVGITLIGVLSGAFGESAIADRLRPVFEGIPLLAPYAGALAITCMVLLITYFSLIIGELVPKRLAMKSPEKIARIIGPLMRGVLFITHPAVRFLSWSTERVLRLLGSGTQTEPSVSEEEIKMLMSEGLQQGVFEASEQRLVSNVFRLDDSQVALIMTPRPDVCYLDLDDDEATQRAVLASASHSHLPVCRGGLTEVLGVLSLPELLQRQLRGEPWHLESLLRPALFVPLFQPPMALVEQFRARREHLALVVDEYGEVQGVVTLTDVLEAMVGELPSDADDHDPDVLRRADGSWLLDGALSLERLRELFPAACEALEPSRDYQTLAGLIFFQLGEVPTTGDQLTWNDLQLEIIDMDGHRIDKVLVTEPQDTPVGDA